MYKIDFYFFGQLLQENLSYTKISGILKENYPYHFPSRFSQSNVNEMVGAAQEEV